MKILILLAIFLLAACEKKQPVQEQKSKPDWMALPVGKSLKAPYPMNAVELPGSNRVLLLNRPLGLPKYGAFYASPDLIVPFIIAIDENHYSSNELFIDTNSWSQFKKPASFLGVYISKHGLTSRTAFPIFKVDKNSVDLTLWNNQSEIRKLNLERWQGILNSNDDAYRERMAKAFRTTNTQTDEVWDDAVDLTVRVRYIKGGYTYMFYKAGNTKHSPNEVEPVNPFQKLTAEIETSPNKDDATKLDVKLYFRYNDGERYYMYKRDYDLEACYWRRAEHVTLQNDPKKVSALLTVNRKKKVLSSMDLTLEDFVTNYFPYATFTNNVSGVTIKAPEKGSIIRVSVDGGPIYGLIEAETEIK